MVQRAVVPVTEPTGSARYTELKKMLADKYREIEGEMRGKMRQLREDGAGNYHQIPEAGEASEDQNDVEWALVQLQVDTLNKIHEALARLEEGTYGHCFECGDEIAQSRLRALPFAVRCKDCEDAREIAQQQEQVQAKKGGGFSLS